ncbi:uncharacterized protein UTRI_03908 [Ustilago trichophora]|uniref:Uncharacterized protein n=1 Tax=Ustilago trichophora TaxID=86804 RepID=A0A5C3EAV0_9BASI|nr:uncharacterized protein UTRI_03908 [Ustilago trichophora]
MRTYSVKIVKISSCCFPNYGFTTFHPIRRRFDDVVVDVDVDVDDVVVDVDVDVDGDVDGDDVDDDGEPVVEEEEGEGVGFLSSATQQELKNLLSTPATTTTTFLPPPTLVKGTRGKQIDRSIVVNASESGSEAPYEVREEKGKTKGDVRLRIQVKMM